MTTRRVLALAASVPLSALLATALTAAPATARPAVDHGDRCLQTAPIRASTAAALARSGCSLAGRVVTNGRVSLTVPPAGMSVVGDGASRNGEVRGLRVTNTGTGIRVVAEGRGSGGGGNWYLAPLPTSTTSTTPASSTSSFGTLVASRAGDPPACKDRTFSLEHHTWRKALSYRINLAKMPKRFTKKTVVHQIRAANANMRKGRNTCGKAQITTPGSHYRGRTSKKPNIGAAGPSCGAGNRNNVVAFGNLPGNLLGWTCYWYIGKRMVGTDMLLDNGPSLSTKLPSPCTNQWDFEGTVTHEWGHAFGLGHTGDGHGNLTMQHLLRPCSKYARTLGLGDWLGMKKMYGKK
ncbi:MAG TPA: hypothetical protein VFM08_07610 [Nocardioides sp.]|jgi:hypothetical protein|nr:hypothetical protein [Nocardioides sp.]